MDSEKPLSETESLTLITSMIRKTKGHLHDNGFYFLLWGWLVFVASVSQYVLLKMDYPEESNYTWAILMPLGGIISGVRGFREGKKKKVKTYTEELLHSVLFAFIIALFIVLVFMSIHGGWTLAYPMVMMVYGMWLFISGSVLKFRPLVIGGIINFACSIGGFYIHTYELILLLSFAVLTGYIIPGHLLNAKFKRENNETV
ncbi:MAG TPA: hypothetical protein VFJ43_02450 [Bacteroidia bacterium]|nr:hypothetical protein [Bacteroidia bacterium]